MIVAVALVVTATKSAAPPTATTKAVSGVTRKNYPAFAHVYRNNDAKILDIFNALTRNLSSHLFQGSLLFSTLQRSLRVKIYRTITLHLSLYLCETWSLMTLI